MSIIDAGLIAEVFGIVQGDGEAVVFEGTVPGEYDPLTDTHGTPTSVTIPGYALDISSDPEAFEPGELVEKQAAALLFMPNDGVSVPPKGFTVVSSGVRRTVDRVAPIRPGGVAFATRVILA